MNNDGKKSPMESGKKSREKSNRFVVYGSVAAIAVIGIAWYFVRAKSQPAEITHSATPQRSFTAKSTHAHQPVASSYTAQPTTTTQVFWNPVSPASRELVNSITDIKPIHGAVTSEQAAQWRNNLKSLIDQGAASVSAIREFLTNNVDLDFNGSAQSAMGYSSVRIALFDALTQIGGAEAEAALSEVLQTTADPHEISAISQNLEKLKPGAHQGQVLDAARQTLAMSSEGSLPGRDVAPLFELLQNLSDYGSIHDITRNANHWNYYSMMALARLPQDGGVPTLIEIARGGADAGSGAQMAALQMLCQVAAQSPEAHNALTDLAQNNKISAYNWATLALFLAGDRMVFQDSLMGNALANVNPNDLRKTQVSASNQSFYTAPLGAQTLEQITQQRALVDELLSITTDPAGIQALQRARTVLQQRATQLNNTQNSG